MICATFSRLPSSQPFDQSDHKSCHKSDAIPIPATVNVLKTMPTESKARANAKTAKISQVRWDGERFEFFPSPFARPQPRPSLHAVACVVGVSPTQGVHPALGHRHSRRSCALFCSLLCAPRVSQWVCPLPFPSRTALSPRVPFCGDRSS